MKEDKIIKSLCDIFKKFNDLELRNDIHFLIACYLDTKRVKSVSRMSVIADTFGLKTTPNGEVDFNQPAVNTDVDVVGTLGNLGKRYEDMRFMILETLGRYLFLTGADEIQAHKILDDWEWFDTYHQRAYALR